jgi:hypothetical protein
MANIYKNEKTSLTTTDLTTLYTVPSNSRAIVKSLLIAEDAAGSAVVKVSPVTDTTQDDISRSVNIVVGPGALGGKTNI